MICVKLTCITTTTIAMVCIKLTLITAPQSTPGAGLRRDGRHKQHICFMI